MASVSEAYPPYFSGCHSVNVRYRPLVSSIYVNSWCIDKHRVRIVQGGGKLFLGYLIDLERRKQVDLLPVIDQQDLQLEAEIGRGVSGVVWKGIWQGMPVAVKQFNEMGLSFNLNEFASEAAIMSVLRHPHIVHCLGGSRVAGKMYLVTELLGRGSLYDIIHVQNMRLSLKRVVTIALDAALGFQYLHSLGIIHRDVKSGNLLLDNEGRTKVGDFGVSRIVAKRMTKAVGTPTYMAPEVISGLAYTEQADVYSFAFVMWEMLAQEVPYKDLSQINIAEMVVSGFRPEIPRTWPKAIAELIVRCWHASPSLRPSFDTIVAYLTKTRDFMEEKGMFKDGKEEEGGKEEEPVKRTEPPRPPRPENPIKPFSELAVEKPREPPPESRPPTSPSKDIPITPRKLPPVPPARRNTDGTVRVASSVVRRPTFTKIFGAVPASVSSNNIIGTPAPSNTASVPLSSSVPANLLSLSRGSIITRKGSLDSNNAKQQEKENQKSESELCRVTNAILNSNNFNKRTISDAVDATRAKGRNSGNWVDELQDTLDERGKR